jgi:flagellar basal-body rod protein FlgB
MSLFDPSLRILSHALDVRLQRQEVLSGNLANVDTPGYEARDVAFEESLENAVAASNQRLAAGETSSFEFLESTSPEAVQTRDTNGDLDATMAALSENAMSYSAASKAAGKKLAILRYAATDGSGG